MNNKSSELKYKSEPASSGAIVLTVLAAPFVLLAVVTVVLTILAIFTSPGGVAGGMMAMLAVIIEIPAVIITAILFVIANLNRKKPGYDRARRIILDALAGFAISLILIGLAQLFALE